MFKIKTNTEESLELKGRIVVPDNREANIDLVRSGCAAADMILVRLVIRLAALMGFNMGTAYIKGAYMKIGPIQREVYVRPPKDCYLKRGCVWRLMKFTYGMADYGRQWLLRVEDWLLGKAGMKRVADVNQVFTRTKDGRIILILAKVIDDFFWQGRRKKSRNYSRN